MIVAADAEALEPVLEQLLANAFRYGAGRPVHMAVQPDDMECTRLTVSDQGPGLAERQIADIFSPIRRAPRFLEPEFGIGLWVAARLTEAMGDTTSAASAQGEGAHFHVSLRLAPVPLIAQPPQNLQTPAVQTEPEGGDQHQGGMT